MQVKVKETTEIINNALKSVQPTKIALGKNTIISNCKMILTDVDGKVCKAVTSTKSRMGCYSWGLTLKNFNDLSRKKK